MFSVFPAPDSPLRVEKSKKATDSNEQPHNHPTSNVFIATIFFIPNA